MPTRSPRSYLLAGVTGVEVVEVVLNARKIADTVGTVHSIIDGNEPNVILGKGDLHQHTRLQIISAET